MVENSTYINYNSFEISFPSFNSTNPKSSQIRPDLTKRFRTLGQGDF